MLEGSEDSEVRIRIMKGYADLMIRPVCRALVVFVFIIAFFVSLYNSQKIRGGMDFNEMVPHSHLRDYLVVGSQLFNKYRSTSGSCILGYKEADFWNRGTLDRPLDFHMDALENDDKVVDAKDRAERDMSGSTFTTLWYAEYFWTYPYIWWLNSTMKVVGTGKPENFYNCLRFLITYTAFAGLFPQLILLDDERQRVPASLGFVGIFTCNWGDIYTSYDCVAYFFNLWDYILDGDYKYAKEEYGTTMTWDFNETFYGEWDYGMYLVSGSFQGWELNVEIMTSMQMVSTLCLIAVIFSSVFFLPSLRGALILGLNTMMIFTHLMASLVYFGYTLNTYTCLNIVLAIGLSVDYSAHIVHAYFTDENAVEGEEDVPFVPIYLGAENEAVRLRLERALFSMAPNVMLGGATTLVGTCVLAFSMTPMFQMFFWLVFALVIASLAHALIFLPCIMCFFPPCPSEKGRQNTILHANRPSSVKVMIRKSQSNLDAVVEKSVEPVPTANYENTMNEETVKPEPTAEAEQPTVFTPAEEADKPAAEPASNPAADV
jgi:hypothetical protein